MQQTTSKRKMQDLTDAERSEVIADMEVITEADARQREAQAAQIEREKRWESVRVSLNPRAYAYVKGIAEETGQTIRRACAEIITHAADHAEHNQ